MSGRAREPRIRRILVALDASAHSFGALEAAVQLAAEMRAEVIGLFVEDSNLLRMADLPMTREVGSYTAVPRDVDLGSLECELRALRSAAERALAQAAEHARVPSTFRVVRGTVSVEVLRVAEEVDLVSVGLLGWASAGRTGVGSTARRLLGRSTGLVLLARRALELGAPVYCVYDGSPAATSALALGARLAEAMDGGMVVLTPEDESDGADALASAAADMLLTRTAGADYRSFASSEPGEIAAAARSGRAGILLLPAAAPWLPPEALHDIVREVSCPVLMVGDLSGASSPGAEAPAA